MKVKWLEEARCEFRDLLRFYKTKVGAKYAKRFADQIMKSTRQLEAFPQSGVLRENTLLGKYGFRALFIGQYVCIYKITEDTVVIYHLADARKNYIAQIFGIEELQNSTEEEQ